MVDTVGSSSSGQQLRSQGAATRLTGLMLAVACVSAIASLLYGYDTGIISGALLQISKDFHTGSGMKQVIASGILLGAVIGALTCSRPSEQIGRHRTILIVSGVYVLGALAASVAPSPWTLSLARVVLGFAVGGATQTVPMYVAEMAPARFRGRLVLTFQVGIGVGIVISVPTRGGLSGPLRATGATRVPRPAPPCRTVRTNRCPPGRTGW